MIEIVDDDVEIEEELVIADIELNEETEIEVFEEEEEEEVEEDVPFMVVENMPALGDCKNLRDEERNQCTQLEIIRYVSENTEYPPIAKDAGIQGTVYVFFVVGKDGKVKDAKVLREVDPRLDKEALRVVQSLPSFEPGQQRGKPVSVQYTIPVRFTIR
jgi:protein TonB